MEARRAATRERRRRAGDDNAGRANAVATPYIYKEKGPNILVPKPWLFASWAKTGDFIRLCAQP
jgi:hypothetical protein